MTAGIKVSEEFVKKFGKKFPPESFLAKEGDPGATMFLIYSGKVAVIKNTPVGEKILATLHDGDFFGEMAILGTQDRRGASVKTLVETVVLELNREAFEAIIRRSPDIAMAVIRSLTDRVRDGNAKATALIHKDDLIRVASYINFLANDRGIQPNQAPGRCLPIRAEVVCAALAIKGDILHGFLEKANKARIVGINGDWLWIPYPQYLIPFAEFMSRNYKGAAH
jgi:CRP-like cAMP-binding protein